MKFIINLLQLAGTLTGACDTIRLVLTVQWQYTLVILHVKLMITKTGKVHL